MKLAIIDYGTGNLSSVKKAFDHINADAKIVSSPQGIDDAHYVVLPGVGSFAKAMSSLNENKWFLALNNHVVVKKKPFLGICLGMQLIFDMGTETKETKGFGWLSGNVVKINAPNKRIPHMGWNTVVPTGNSSLFTEDLKGDYYFIHSYHAVSQNKNHIAATVQYGEVISAIFHYENIFACQFHPEKSQILGLELLKRFLKFYA